MPSARASNNPLDSPKKLCNLVSLVKLVACRLKARPLFALSETDKDTASVKVASIATPVLMLESERLNQLITLWES